MTKTSKAPADQLRRLDKHWHLATDDAEVAITELEFSLIRVASAFERWQSDCLACCHGNSFSGADTAVLHVIRMHERAKSISEIGRLLKRDDQSNLQYSIRKLLKAGLIEKTSGGGKKGVTYQVSNLGHQVTDRYAEFRQELLTSLATTVFANHDLEAVAKTMNLMSGVYDQASCVAATHRVPA
ncbi:MAG: winged helix DNA-binding protein [Lysobacterales bacterium]